MLSLSLSPTFLHVPSSNHDFDLCQFALTHLVSMSKDTNFFLFISLLSFPSQTDPSPLGSIIMGGRCHDEHNMAAFSICLGPKSERKDVNKLILILKIPTEISRLLNTFFGKLVIFGTKFIAITMEREILQKRSFFFNILHVLKSKIYSIMHVRYV